MAIILNGFLEEKYGKHHNPKVKTAIEAFQAMDAICPGFRYDVAKFGSFIVTANDRIVSEQTLFFTQGEDVDFTITPIVYGQGSDTGIISAAIGVVAIVAGAYFQQPWLVQVGIGMVAGGIAGMLSPVPNLNYGDSEDTTPSNIFRGPLNSTEVGKAVPLVYGETWCGSIIISVGERVTEVLIDDSDDDYISTSTAKILHLICEGEVEGAAIDDDWEKSIYLNGTPIKNDDDSYNFQGIDVYARTGTTNQKVIPDFNGVENSYSVATEVLNSTPITRTISDSDIDDVYVTVSVNSLYSYNKKKGLQDRTLTYTITLTPTVGSPATIKTNVVTDKITSPHEYQHKIEDLSQYGTGPYQITVTKIDADHNTEKNQNVMYFDSYVEVINDKFSYPDSCIIGLNVDAAEFGNQMPNMAVKIKGRKILIPSNYDPEAKIYSGEWDGTFKEDKYFTDNPAWIIYDYLLNGSNLGIDPDYINKWSLYSIAQYCDETVSVTVKTRQADGTYSSTTEDTHRFTFNGMISNRDDFENILKNLCSSCNANYIQNGQYIHFVQDVPYTSGNELIVSQANVIDGNFDYKSTRNTDRITVVKASYADPDNFGKNRTLYIADTEGLSNGLSHNEVDLILYGCNSEQEARRKANWLLYSCIHQVEFVNFKTSIEFANILPGQLIKIQDSHRANTRLSGRISSATSTSVKLDAEIEIEYGKTYTLYLPKIDGSGSHILTCTNSIGFTDTLTWIDPIEVLPANHIWAVEVSDLALQTFKVTSVKEIDKTEYEINAVSYDANKWAFESGVVVEVAPTIQLPESYIEAPTNISIEPYASALGDLGSTIYGMNISWEHANDPRRIYYEVQSAFNNGAYKTIGNSTGNSFDYREIEAGTYDIRVRSCGITQNSSWLTYNDYTMICATSGTMAPTGLQIKGGGTEWAGRDMEFEWTPSSGAYYNERYVDDYNIKGYQIQILKTDDTLLRTLNVDKKETEWRYTYEMNNEDNSGDPQRSLKVNLYTIDVYDNLSLGYDTDVFSNAAPDMSAVTPDIVPGPTYASVSWNHPSDIDLNKYELYFGVSSPPTSAVAEIPYPASKAQVFNMTYGTTYYLQVLPHDEFGSGDGSVIVPVTSTQVSSEDVDIELQTSIVMSDSISSSASQLATLYDSVTTSGGIIYNTGDWAWVQYELPVEDIINAVQLWSPSAAQVCVALSSDGSTWNYFSANASHQLVLSNSQYRLISAPDLSTAQTNYWETDPGYNIAYLPNTAAARYCRLYINATTSKTIYELVFRRIVVAEDMAVEQLSAIAGDVGNLTAGVLQSQDYIDSAGTDGMQIDLNNNTLLMRKDDTDILNIDAESGTGNFNGTFTFSAGSSGYGNILDAPNRGVNIVPGKYSVFNVEELVEDTDYVVSDGTVSLITTEDFFKYYGKSLRLLSNSTTATVYLSDNSGTYNIPIEAGKKWLLSAWVRSQGPSNINLNGQMAVKRNSDDTYTSFNFTTSPSAGQWKRIHGEIDFTGDTSTMCHLRLTNNGGSGVPMWFDGIMMEEIISSISTPSSFNCGSTIINGGQIETESIRTNQLAADCVVTKHIAAGCVIAEHVGTNEVIANIANIANGLITSAKIGDGEITNAKIGVAEVDTIQIAGNAVTIPAAATSTAVVFSTGTVDTWYSVSPLSLTYNGEGSQILVQVGGAFYGDYVRVLRNGTPIHTLPLRDSSGGYFQSNLTFLHSPGTGNFTYTIQVHTYTSGTVFYGFFYPSIVILGCLR